MDEPTKASKVSEQRAASHWVALAAATTAVATLVPIALYQSKIIRTLPDPPSDLFDSETITSSKSAHPLGIPDSYLGLGSYAATLFLLSLAKNSVLARRLLSLKLDADANLAVINFSRQIVSFKKLCSWCTGTALATAILVPAGKAYLRQLKDEQAPL